MANPKTAGAAVRTFPILLRWGLRTRPGAHPYPIGGPGRRSSVTDEEKRACVRDNAATLYHDLGVVAFDGCSYGQARRLGVILARAVALGATRTETGGVRVPEESALEAFELFPELWRLEEETWGPRLKEEESQE
ncbi:HAD family hydrolase [Cordyceps fumosorosea ARSEF 2679]|uniref:HAD family hydrolase n=1 Tax=Cordyceps fumosorosea (strain ARSEF 2679) TaxID=1081104 RepID=A0A167YFS4_CORFA|nr:HAD family hydrolase [Cordyceps fumosorosea ARSEF 2679]OAA66273.1 HAD family hydrolase [Cordyceps fumosorosea ARSEF 2679]